MEDNKVIFNLYCPTTMDEKRHYLVLIDFLVQELRKYTEVEVLGEELLIWNKAEMKKELFSALLTMYTQKANLEGISINEFFKRYPVETLCLDEPEAFKNYLIEKGILE